MCSHHRLALPLASALFLVAPAAVAQTAPVSGLYQILSGTYAECCGFGGEVRVPLPNDSQAFVNLELDPATGLASMAFLGQDAQTIFGVLPCPPGDPIQFNFSYGFVVGDSIIFHVDPGPPPNFEYWNYSVSNSAGALRITGEVGIGLSGCADVSTSFTHSNLVAVFIPTPAIRVSEVQICWNSISNRNYQLQYRSALTTNAWVDLGPSVGGNGSTTCVPDKVPPGEPQRFYRILTLP